MTKPEIITLIEDRIAALLQQLDRDGALRPATKKTQENFSARIQELNSLQYRILREHQKRRQEESYFDPLAGEHDPR
jgi:hypothetical protein